MSVNFGYGGVIKDELRRLRRTRQRYSGADFVLSLLVFLLKSMAQRHVLGQVKLTRGNQLPIDTAQLQVLTETAGGELGVYTYWGHGVDPEVVTSIPTKSRRGGVHPFHSLFYIVANRRETRRTLAGIYPGGLFGQATGFYVDQSDIDQKA